MIKIFLVLLMAAAAESKETVLEQGTEVIIQEEGVEGSGEALLTDKLDTNRNNRAYFCLQSVPTTTLSGRSAIP